MDRVQHRIETRPIFRRQIGNAMAVLQQHLYEYRRLDMRRLRERCDAILCRRAIHRYLRGFDEPRLRTLASDFRGFTSVHFANGYVTGST